VSGVAESREKQIEAIVDESVKVGINVAGKGILSVFWVVCIHCVHCILCVHI